MAIFKDYGRRLVISIVDEMARDKPGWIVYSIAISQDISKGLHDISARQFANAANRTAWWLESELGKGSLLGRRGKKEMINIAAAKGPAGEHQEFQGQAPAHA